MRQISEKVSHIVSQGWALRFFTWISLAVQQQDPLLYTQYSTSQQMPLMPLF